MSLKKTKAVIHQLAESAGIQFNGSNPWDPQIHNDAIYSKVIHQGSLGLGDAYMDGWWDCEKLDEYFIEFESQSSEKILTVNILPLILNKLNIFQALILNQQNKKRALKVGKQHYDVGNDLYQCMLDKNMNYTCGYWKEAKNLDEAQEAKLKLVCDKLYLKSGQKVLDIGCGWGGFAKYAAENYSVHVVGVTISQEQLKLGKKRCAGLPVELRFQDYRDVNEKFDHIVSLGMIEHVGYKNYGTYMQVARRCLKDEGLFLLHTIGALVSTVKTDPWIGKYIFPNSMLPSIKQLSDACEKRFVIEDLENFSAYYDNTLMAWHKNFTHHWDELKGQYDQRFYRMWSYYLLCCAGSFRARDNQLWQFVLSPKGVPGGYRRP